MADNQRNIQSDAVDQQLQAALGMYAAVEPRVGLEERILANLRAQRTHVPARGRWQWAVLSIVAVVIILVLSVSWRTRKPRMVKAPNPITKPHVGDTKVASNPVLPPRPVPSVRTAVTIRAPHSSQSATATPRLSRFPSPEAMSDQEKMLADYAGQFQEQAVLIARFNEEDLRCDRMELIGNAQNDPNGARFDNEETELR